jgi:WhiB family redox-sensing transcriptional regulator
VSGFLTKNSESFDTATYFVKDFTFEGIRANPRRQNVLTVTDWRELSACRDSDPDIFFPIGTTGPAVGLIDKATAICTACSVVEECLLYALETNQEAGVWGGLPEDDRRRFRKRWLAERRRRRQAS